MPPEYSISVGIKTQIKKIILGITYQNYNSKFMKTRTIAKIFC